jgi:hypothetical protein
MRLVITILLISKFYFAYSNEYNCKVVFSIKNSTDDNYYAHFIDDNNVIYLDKIVDKIDSFYVNIKEPKNIIYMITNDTSKMTSFYIYPGRVYIDIDAKNVRNSTIYDSPLNDELFKYRIKHDSITNSIYTPFVIKLLKDKKEQNLYDSIKVIYDKHLQQQYKKEYKEGFYNLKSFGTLNFIDFHLTYTKIFTKKQLKKLFNKLDKSMKEYPTYQRCETMFKQKVPKRPVINEPLYK